jgi:hypothetical protein
MSTGTVMSTLIVSGMRVSSAQAPPVPLLPLAPGFCGMFANAPPAPVVSPLPALVLVLAPVPGSPPAFVPPPVFVPGRVIESPFPALPVEAEQASGRSRQTSGARRRVL